MTKKEIKKEKENFLKTLREKKRVLIEQMLGTTSIESRLQMFLLVSIDDLRRSTEKSSKAANMLFVILIILTAVLAFGAVIGAISVL